MARRELQRLGWRLKGGKRLPDFLIIGAQKGGTTSLYRYLSEHPQIGAASRKELNYFDSEFHRGVDWYHRQFPPASSSQRSVTGEASPSYLLNPRSAERAAALVPQALIVVLLRNPVDRAYSHYQMVKRRGYESLSFEEAIDQEAARREQERVAIGDDPDSEHAKNRRLWYFRRGEYADQLDRWLAVYPMDRFLVIASEELSRDPASALETTLAALDLPPIAMSTFERAGSFSYPPMEPATRSRLLETYRPHNERLFSLLGRTFDWDR